MPFVDAEESERINIEVKKESFNFKENDIIKIMENDFSIIVTSPEQLVLDKRNVICCEYSYCPSYDTKCYCPPNSLSVEKFEELRKKYKYCIILINVVSPEDWTWVLKGNVFDENKHKVYFRRWAQNITWSIYKKKLVPIWKDTDSYLLFGTSISKCNKCKEKDTKNGRCKTGIAWSSPEAVGINVGKTLGRLGFPLKFGVTYDITRIGIILTNEEIHYKENYSNIKKVPRYKQKFMLLEEMANRMAKEIGEKVYILKTNSKYISSNFIITGSEGENEPINIKWWEYAIIFELKSFEYGNGRAVKMGKIQGMAFMNNYPYAIVLDEIRYGIKCDMIKEKMQFGVVLI